MLVKKFIQISIDKDSIECAVYIKYNHSRKEKWVYKKVDILDLLEVDVHVVSGVVFKGSQLDTFSP